MSNFKQGKTEILLHATQNKVYSHTIDCNLVCSTNVCKVKKKTKNKNRIVLNF